MPTVDPPRESGPPSLPTGLRPGLPDLAMLGVAVVAWGWLLSALRDRPVELAGLAVAVPVLAGIGLMVDRFFGRVWGGSGVVVMGIVGFLGLFAATGASPKTLAGFMLGLVKPVGWGGDHLLLRVVPLAMLLAHPWRASRPGMLVSALGVTAFLGITLLILHAAG